MLLHRLEPVLSIVIFYWNLRVWTWWKSADREVVSSGFLRRKTGNRVPAMFPQNYLYLFINYSSMSALLMILWKKTLANLRLCYLESVIKLPIIDFNKNPSLDERNWNYYSHKSLWNMLRVILVASLWKLKICIHNEVWTKSRVIIIKNIFT